MATVTTRNITRVFRTATDDQLANGMAWYLDAGIIAESLADAHGVTVEQSAGIIAALSPMMSWGSNVNLAARFLGAGGLDLGALSLSLSKARAILAGDDIVTALAGNKTTAFYRCIATLGMTDAVCIDRHAYDVATATRHNDATRPKLSDKRYRECVDAYRRASRILSKELGAPISPAQVQAVTWVVWRARYWADGAFD